MLGGTNYSEGGISNRPVEPSVNWSAGPSGHSNAEGKAAEKVIGLFDKMSFDTVRFAHNLVSAGGDALRRRIMDVAINIIKTYAIQWDVGAYQDDVARDAKRLKDTLDQFKM